MMKRTKEKRTRRNRRIRKRRGRIHRQDSIYPQE